MLLYKFDFSMLIHFQNVFFFKLRFEILKYSGAVLIALIKRFRDKEVCGNHMTRICVKLFIEKKESSVVRFMSDFNKLTVSDEKVIIIYPKIYLVHVVFIL